jgi:hypothetical protein
VFTDKLAENGGKIISTSLYRVGFASHLLRWFFVPLGWLIVGCFGDMGGRVSSLSSGEVWPSGEYSRTFNVSTACRSLICYSRQSKLVDLRRIGERFQASGCSVRRRRDQPGGSAYRGCIVISFSLRGVFVSVDVIFNL